jgi:glycosyltransferase involved in cell wall biosynthesis
VAKIWFWQLIISPHTAELAVQLASLGCSVTFVTQKEITADRAKQGWQVPNLNGVALLFAQSSAAAVNLARSAPEDAIHFCQGARANGYIASAQRELSALRRRQWVTMETVDDRGVVGWFKRHRYTSLLGRGEPWYEGVLAVGHRTRDWLIHRGASPERVFPFAYFLPSPSFCSVSTIADRPFRLLYVGQMIPRKRVDFLIAALQKVPRTDFELWMAGTGPHESRLRRLAVSKFESRLRWLGALPLGEVPKIMAQVDCLVLPSIHDGWGAVASESLMVGTPVICSDGCGVAEVVQRSGSGGVFEKSEMAEFTALLAKQLESGPLGHITRRQLAEWAECLNASSGASYLLNILDRKDQTAVSPVAPWARGNVCAA